MTTDKMIPTGSQAKMWTAMNVLRLIEAGKLDFNDTVPSLVDDILYKMNKTSILEIWGGR